MIVAASRATSAETHELTFILTIIYAATMVENDITEPQLMSMPPAMMTSPPPMPAIAIMDTWLSIVIMELTFKKLGLIMPKRAISTISINTIR